MKISDDLLRVYSYCFIDTIERHIDLYYSIISRKGKPFISLKVVYKIELARLHTANPEKTVKLVAWLFVLWECT